MGVQYRGNQSPQRIAAGLQARKGAVLNEVEQIVTETVAEASKLQKEILDAAVTPYGSERFGKGQGRSAGRNDSGNMIDSIDDDVKRQGKTRVEGRWGWLDGEYEDYFGFQEKIRGVRSLMNSYMVMSNRFRARISKVGRG